MKKIEKVKEVEYENITIKELMEAQKTQNLNQTLQDIIMDFNDGYVATANSFNINVTLRDDIPWSHDEKKTIDALDHLISSNSLQRNLTLHRFLNDDFISDKFGIHTWGKSTKEIVQSMKDVDLKEFSDKGFCSVSALEKKNVFWERKYQLEIRAKKGTPGFITSNFVESEIILSRNQSMKVIDIVETDKGRIKVIVETD